MHTIYNTLLQSQLRIANSAVIMIVVLPHQLVAENMLDSATPERGVLRKLLDSVVTLEPTLVVPTVRLRNVVTRKHSR